MREQECVPFAPALIESMRSLGYSFPSAIADLIDNSVSAMATEINILTKPSSSPYMIILDDGCGMSRDELYEAMRYGSNPLVERSERDLGRFGLGLKSASLSQCKNLVVVSKKDGEINACSWDLDFVAQRGAWVLKVFSEEELTHFPEIEKLKNMEHGTYVYLDNFDRIREGAAVLHDTFAKNLDDMVNHLSLVFHRYLEDGLIIKVNDLQIEPKDPFLKYHRATQRKR